MAISILAEILTNEIFLLNPEIILQELFKLMLYIDEQNKRDHFHNIVAKMDKIHFSKDILDFAKKWLLKNHKISREEIKEVMCKVENNNYSELSFMQLALDVKDNMFDFDTRKEFFRNAAKLLNNLLEYATDY